MEYESADGHVFVAFGESQVKHLVDFVYLQSGREQIFSVVELLGDIKHFVLVAFVRNFTHYLLDDVFERHDAAGTAKLVDHHAQ